MTPPHTPPAETSSAPDEVLLAISTFPDCETAVRIAERLVSERLAACANIGPEVQSIYWWEGKVENASETMVFFKTTRACIASFQERLKSLHPYDVPEMICTSVVSGLPEYLAWLRNSCGTAGAP